MDIQSQHTQSKNKLQPSSTRCCEEDEQSDAILEVASLFFIYTTRRHDVLFHGLFDYMFAGDSDLHDVFSSKFDYRSIADAYKEKKDLHG